FHRDRCAEHDAVRRRVRRIDNMDRCQSVVEFGVTLADGVCRAKFLKFVLQMLRAAGGDIISRTRRQSRGRSFPSAALRRIDIFFNERPAHLKEYRSIVSLSVSDFVQPMSNSLLANGADGISDIEGKAVTGSGEEGGTRGSFDGAEVDEREVGGLSRGDNMRRT